MLQENLKNWLKKIKLNESTISTILGGLVVMIVGLLIFNYFRVGKKGEISIEKPKESAETSVIKNSEGNIPENLPVKHKVKEGDTLWKISEQYYNSGYNWVDIAKENNLVNPDYLEAGKELKLPKVAIKKITKTDKQTNTVFQRKETAVNGSTYKIVKGDTLWLIAIKAYADGYKWPTIAQANNLTNPNYIEVDQELKLPR